MKEMSVFCYKNLLEKLYSTRADNLCKHYNLHPDIVSKELVKFKKHKLMEENIDVSDLLPEPDKKNEEEEEKYEDNLLHFNSENEGEETEEEEEEEEEKDRRKKKMSLTLDSPKIFETF